MRDDWGTLTVASGRELRICIPAHAHDGLAAKLRDGSALSSVARLLIDLVGSDGTLLDLGAHLGSACMPVAALGATVIAVEASPTNARCLEASIEANALDVTVINAAVSDQPGKVSFWESGPYGRIAAGDDVANCEVEAFTVPEILQHCDARPAAIKLDVEGHEPPVLHGMLTLLRAADAPPLVFESNGHALRHAGHRITDLTATLREVGYSLFRLHDTDPVLIELDADDLQSRTVVDILAVKATPVPWPVRAPFSADERTAEFVRELGHVNPLQRAFAAAELAHARRALLAQPQLALALDACVDDPEEGVRDAAEWWRFRRVRIAASNDGVTDASTGSKSRQRVIFERVSRPFLAELDTRFAQLQGRLEQRLHLIEQRLDLLHLDELRQPTTPPDRDLGGD